MWRRREQYDVHVGLQNLLVGVESNKTAAVGNLLFPFLGEDVATTSHAVAEDVTEGGDLKVGSRAEKLLGRARSAFAATDQPGFQERTIRRFVDEPFATTRQYRSGSNCHDR